MTIDDETDTIYAVSTAAGRAAVAVIRVSGSRSASVLERICGKSAFPDRRASLATLFDEQGSVLDRAIVIRFAAPRSYTGEDMIEFQVVGGRAVVGALLKALAQCPGTRPAEAGEFALRAFVNGKVDLAEVEGLAAVVEAETRAQLRHAQTMASGELSRQCEHIRSLLVIAMAQVESALDFSDIDGGPELDLDIQTVLEAEAALRQLLEGDAVFERLRDGMTVVLAGPPNVGKSTLLNYLAKRDVAIVSPTPGTTRDILEVPTELAGFPVTFVDTAGFRASSDPIEAEGIHRARQRSARADLVLWLFEESPCLPEEAETWPVLPVRTKADLTPFVDSADERMAISARTGKGIDVLLTRIADLAQRHFDGAGRVSVGTQRQISAARAAAASLQRIIAQQDRPLEIAAEDLRQATQALGRIAGRVGVEEVLGEIFSRLCVGK